MDATKSGLRANLVVDDMSCDHCVAAVQSALRGISGLKVLHVEVGSADVEAVSSDLVASAVAAIADAGFVARVGRIESAPAATAINKGCRGMGGGGCGCGNKA